MEDLVQSLFENPVVRKLAARFRESPYALYLVGGCVRDAVAGRSDFSDLDFTTDALPDQIEYVVGTLGPLWLAGKRFGTIGVFIGGEKVEITTFRGESYEDDSRKPEVFFSTDIAEDLSRRDFTVNALAIRVDGESAELIDYHQGVRDLHDGILRTPGAPDATITEDPLRAVRAVRFATTRGFRLSVTLQDAIRRNAARLQIVATERVMEECRKIISSGATAVADAWFLSRTLGIKQYMFGDLNLVDHDAYNTLAMMKLSGPTALALMVCETAEGEIDIDSLLSPLTFSNAEKDDIKKIATTAMQLKDSQARFSIRALRRTMDIDTFATASLVSDLAYHLDESQLDALFGVLTDKRLDAPLPVKGEDVMATLGCPPGPFVGAALNFLEGMFCVDPSMTREHLLESLVLTSR